MRGREKDSPTERISEWDHVARGIGKSEWTASEKAALRRIMPVEGEFSSKRIN
jgi:hypothetical protein